MFLDLNKIGPEGLRIDRAIVLPELEGAAGEKLSLPRARLTGEVTRGKRGFDFSGRLVSVVRLPCSRCLEPYEMEIVREFFLLLVPEGTEEERSAEYAEDEEAVLFPCPDGRADLVQMAMEQVYLDLPLKPICREGCRGLCPTCGANRNVEDCRCPGEAVDPRLAPLLRLKDGPQE